jgi:hypothetical protein
MSVTGSSMITTLPRDLPQAAEVTRTRLARGVLSEAVHGPVGGRSVTWR